MLEHQQFNIHTHTEESKVGPVPRHRIMKATRYHINKSFIPDLEGKCLASC
jgi:hypothetical protein